MKYEDASFACVENELSDAYRGVAQLSAAAAIKAHDRGLLSYEPSTLTETFCPPKCAAATTFRSSGAVALPATTEWAILQACASTNDGRAFSSSACLIMPV